MENKIEVIINISGERKFVSVQYGDNLLDILRKENIALQSPCGGRGTCGKCRVHVLKGGVEPSDTDTKHLSKEDINEGVRLACGLNISGSIEIELSGGYGKMDIMTGGQDADIEVNPHASKRFMELNVPSIEDQRNDCTRIIDGFGIDSMVISHEMMIKIPDILRQNDFNVTAGFYKNILLDIEPGDTRDKQYGIAVDIGTTTIACYLIDLFSGKLIDIESAVNNQRAYGADVISRINYTMENEEGTKTLKNSIIRQINDIVEILRGKNVVEKKNIYNMVIAGNTTMIHLFLGLACRNIALAPYIPVTTGIVELHAKDAGIGINGYVTILPGVASYVGSDITAGILSCGMYKSKDYSLLLDLGTNGEIALGNCDGIITCSTAAGPAFEGANIKCGIGGIKGAISKIDLSREKIYDTLGGDSPCGICGSGVLDMVSQLMIYNLIDETGRMAALDDVPSAFKDRMINQDGMKEFVIEGSIVFTQKDVREVQLAKAAVCAGIQILIKEKNLQIQDVENVYIAGGFGNYMNIESALSIGMLPKEFSGKIKSIGNSAGTGAKMCLMSAVYSDEIMKIIDNTGYIELSNRSDFQDYFVDSMMFGGM